MLLPGTISPTWLLFAVLISLIVISETLEGSRHARDVHRRSDDESDDENDKKANSRDSSGSESDDHKKISIEKPAPKNSAPSESESSEENGNDSIDKLHSTRALRPEEYDPEETPKLHKYKKVDEDEDDGDKLRRKRSIQDLAIGPEILA